MTAERLRWLAAGFRKRSQSLDQSHPTASYWYGLASLDYRYAADHIDAGNTVSVKWHVLSARNSTRVARRRQNRQPARVVSSTPAAGTDTTRQEGTDTGPGVRD